MEGIPNHDPRPQRRVQRSGVEGSTEMRPSHEPCDNCGHDRTYHAPGRVNPCQHLPSAAVTRMTGLLRCDCDGFRNGWSVKSYKSDSPEAQAARAAIAA